MNTGYRTTAFAVLAVIVMVTAGMGVVFNGTEDTEATWGGPETPVASLTMNAYQLWLAYDNGTEEYVVGYGTYVNIQQFTGDDYEYRVTSVLSDYGTGDTAGLTFNSYYGHAIGSINKSLPGEVQITITYEDSGGVETPVTISLWVIDMRSTAGSPWRVIDLPAIIFEEWGTLSGNVFYVEVGSTVTVTECNVTEAGSTHMNYGVNTVTSGFGLIVPAGTSNLTGTVTQTGTMTIEVYVTDGVDIEEQDVTMIAVDTSHADVRMIGGETWTYTPSTNIASVISVSGTATAWVSLTGGTVSGTAPSNTSVGQTYELTITASTTQPVQTVTQTVSFTVDPQITITASNASQSIIYGAGSVDIISSNFEDGTRSIYSLTGTAGYSVNAVNGVISYTAPNSGSVTITATSPYTYTSGATNSASTSVTFDVAGRLSASVSGTLYLVTGKTVPNTPAEAVTLNHNDVGTGTYTWAVSGVNDSGVTVASDGTIAGTPGAVGDYAITVTCTSVVGGTTQTADATLNVVIVAVLVFTSTPSQGTIV